MIQIGSSWILNQNCFLPNSLPTTLCLLSGWVEFTDVCISGGTCGGGGQVITTWSHSRPAKRGTHTICTYAMQVNACSKRNLILHTMSSLKMSSRSGARSTTQKIAFRFISYIMYTCSIHHFKNSIETCGFIA